MRSIRHACQHWRRRSLTSNLWDLISHEYIMLMVRVSIHSKSHHMRASKASNDRFSWVKNIQSSTKLKAIYVQAMEYQPVQVKGYTRHGERIVDSGTGDYGGENNPVLVQHFPKKLLSDAITLTEFTKFKNMQGLVLEVDAPDVESLVSDGYAYICVTQQFEGQASHRNCWLSCLWSRPSYLKLNVWSTTQECCIWIAVFITYHNYIILSCRILVCLALISESLGLRFH